jgi:integrase
MSPVHSGAPPLAPASHSPIFRAALVQTSAALRPFHSRFASLQGWGPYHPTEIQKRHLRPPGCCVVACPTCRAAPGLWCWQGEPTANGKRALIHDTRKLAAGKLGKIGWHTFRHTYRSWLDETGAPMKVQQEQMRHASIQTTMNIYGQAMSSSKREANGKVVEMVLKPVAASA